MEGFKCLTYICWIEIDGSLTLNEDFLVVVFMKNVRVPTMYRTRKPFFNDLTKSYLVSIWISLIGRKFQRD